MTDPLEKKKTRSWRIAFWFLAIGLGWLYAWAYRHNIRSLDGISYLEMGEAYLRGDWGMAVNGYWSPFYSWLLGLALLILQPTPYWEYSVFQLVNLVVYL